MKMPDLSITELLLKDETVLESLIRHYDANAKLQNGMIKKEGGERIFKELLKAQESIKRLRYYLDGLKNG